MLSSSIQYSYSLFSIIKKLNLTKTKHTRIFILIRYWSYVTGAADLENRKEREGGGKIYTPYLLYYPLLIPNIILGTALYLYINWVLEQLFIHNP